MGNCIASGRENYLFVDGPGAIVQQQKTQDELFSYHDKTICSIVGDRDEGLDIVFYGLKSPRSTHARANNTQMEELLYSIAPRSSHVFKLSTNRSVLYGIYPAATYRVTGEVIDCCKIGHEFRLKFKQLPMITIEHEKSHKMTVNALWIHSDKHVESGSVELVCALNFDGTVLKVI